MTEFAGFGDGPMAAGGYDVDMTTGLPREHPETFTKQRARLRYEESLEVALALASDLRTNSQVLVEVFRAYSERLRELSGNDPICRAFERIIGAWRKDLEIAPALAEKQARKVLGSQMDQIVQESEAAPQ